MRTVLAGVFGLVAAVALSSCGGSTSDSSASCAAPELTVSPSSAAAGEKVTVTGLYFLATCNDVVENGEEPPPNRPQPDVPLHLVSGAADHPLGTAHAEGDLGRFTVDVTVPADATPGRYDVTAPTTIRRAALTVEP